MIIKRRKLKLMGEKVAVRISQHNKNSKEKVRRTTKTKFKGEG